MSIDLQAANLRSNKRKCLPSFKIATYIFMDAIHPLPQGSRPDLLNWNEVKDLNETLPKWEPSLQKRELKNDVGEHTMVTTRKTVRSVGLTQRAFLLAEKIWTARNRVLSFQHNVCDPKWKSAVSRIIVNKMRKLSRSSDKTYKEGDQMVPGWWKNQGAVYALVLVWSRYGGRTFSLRVR